MIFAGRCTFEEAGIYVLMCDDSLCNLVDNMGAIEANGRFQDEYLNYGFPLNDVVETTIVRHNGGQPHEVSCLVDGCGKIYKGQYAQRNLARHIRTKHDCVVFQCTECDRIYQRDDALLEHERNRHPNLERSPKIPRRKPEESRNGTI